MAAVLTGTPVAVVWAAGADPAGQSITIPADATAVYMFWTFYHGTAGYGLASVTLAGASPSQTFETPTAATDNTATGVAVWYNPPTGSQTLDPAWGAAPVEGPTTVVAFVKGGDTVAWRDADAANENGATACTVTLTTESGDLVIKYDQRYDTGANVPALSAGWTNGATQDNNSEHSRLSYISATGTTQVCNSEDNAYSSVCAVSIPAASVASTAITGKMPGKVVHPGFRGPPSFSRFIRSPRDTSILAAAGAQTLVQSSTFTNSNAFYAGQINLRLVQSSTFTNSNAFYAGTVDTGLGLIQSSTFTNSNAFYAGTVTNSNTTLLTGRAPGRLIRPGGRGPYVFSQFLRGPRVAPVVAAAQTLNQSSTFTNSSVFYAGTVDTGLGLTQSSTFTNISTFYAGQINLRLVQSSTFTNSSVFYAGTVDTGLGLIQSSTFTNSNAFYAGQINLRLVQSSTFTNPNAFYAGRANLRLNQSSRYGGSNLFYGGTLTGASPPIFDGGFVPIVRRRIRL